MVSSSPVAVVLTCGIHLGTEGPLWLARDTSEVRAPDALVPVSVKLIQLERGRERESIPHTSSSVGEAVGKLHRESFQAQRIVAFRRGAKTQTLFILYAQEHEALESTSLRRTANFAWLHFFCFVPATKMEKKTK